MKHHIWTKLIWILLVVSLMTGTVFAAGSFSNFRSVNQDFDRFQDVSETAWYAESVEQAYEYGLMQGRSQSKFSPSGTLTVAECVALADRLHSIYEKDGAEFQQKGKPWYTDYVRYAVEHRILSVQMLNEIDCTAKITRGLFARILSRAMPAGALEAINDIPDGSIPDVKPGSEYYPAIYQLYRAGVLTGSDEVGSAKPDSTIKRSEAAAILLRMAVPEQRQRLTLQTELTIYAPTGTSKTILATQYPGYQAKGWATEPVTTVYCWDGSTSTVKNSKLEHFLEGSPNWAPEPFEPMPKDIAEQAHTTAGIPVIRIDTKKQEPVLSNKDYVNRKVSLFNVPKSMAIQNEKCEIRLRGNSSSFYGDVDQILSNPVPYRLKFDEKISLMGLNDGIEARSWVLLTNLDNGVFKNDVAFRLGRALLEPDGDYCSDATPVHLYLNGKFWGIYLLCEQNQVNENRVDVSEPDKGYTKTDIGYFLELDMYGDEPSFTLDYADGAPVSDTNGVKRALRPALYSIKSDIYSAAQKRYITKYLRNLFEILYRACVKNEYYGFDRNHDLREVQADSAREAIENVADLQSMVDMYILYELMCDYDVGQSSFYMCVDFSADSRFPKLTFTAPWDFNWTCSDSVRGVFAGAFRTEEFVQQSEDRSNPWFILLYRQKWFREMVKERWRELGGLEAVTELVNQEKQLIKVYQDDINSYTPEAAQGCRGDLEWILQRAAWLEKQWS